MADAKTLLIVDDDPDIRTAGKLLLKRRFDQVVTTGDPADIPTLMRDALPDVILLDMNFGPGESSGRQGLEWLEKIKAMDSDATVIVITAHGGVQTAVEAMKRGATDFVAKPWQNEKLVATVDAAATLRSTRRRASALEIRNRELARNPTIDNQFIGDSPPMREVFELIERTAPTDANILILGENGTGKELAARALHQNSPRRNEVFMSVDLGAVAENLFESELFGHRKGAFTGANSDRAGRFVAAHGGTIFLDEVGNLPLHLQAKLLTVLEQRAVTPLGTETSIPFDVRVITATNLPLSVLNDERRFRRDLLFRLKTVELTMPPLRVRTGDVIPLTEYYLRRFERKYDRPEKRLHDDLSASLEHYDWPGNVRELRHAAERAVILAANETYTPADFSLMDPAASGEATSDTEKMRTQKPVFDDDLNLKRLERTAVETALHRHRFNISKAAEELGLTRAALYRRMEKHGL
ncbi:MAG: sigma-54 dependent transcriptional regulator [Pseudomonadota bacterium]